MNEAISLSTLRRKGIIFLVQVFACLVMLLISTNSISGVPEQIGMTVISFVQRGFDAVGDFFANTANALRELRELRMRYNDLAGKMEQYKNLERGYIELKQENERLKEQLGFDTTSGYVKTAASIIAKDPENLYTTFVIDKGAVDGLRKNLPVLAYQNGIEGLVGRILEVGRSSSIVVPVYDGNSFIASRLDRTRYDGLLTGTGSDNDPLMLRYVKKRAKDEIQFGDLVVTAGYQSLYPKDIAIGRVGKIFTTDYQASLDIEVESVLDFGRLEYVFVIQPESMTEDR
ncbi:MAG: rod shape-determining protein MreC [Spirochaetes bacterium]|nr:rod shape-determining protein MreC [Spirochaetota bacterium]